MWISRQRIDNTVLILQHSYGRVRSWSASALRYLYWSFVLASLVFTFFCFFRLPPAGVAIGFLGGVGVIVALVGDNKLTTGHRILWAVLTLCFLVIEVQAIKKDRKEQFGVLTGGDDFGFMVYKNGGPSNFSFPHQGEYTLFDVYARFVDLKKLTAGSTWQEDNKSSYDLGDFAKDSGTFIDPSVPFSDEQKQDFNIFFNARNGFWEQALRLRFVNGHWSTATRVIRRQTKSTLYERIDADYPRNSSGGVDW
jgi:hypothetical protein